MTREEAIQILADLIDSPFLHTWEKQNKALHMAIEALQEKTSNKYTIKEVKEILELAIGEVELRIPSDVIEQTLQYLTEYENMKIAESWDKYPEEMGR